MAKLRHLRSSVAGRRPLAADLLPGQIFINRADRSISVLDSDNAVVDIGQAVSVGSINFWTNRASIQGGYFALDGQELSQATFPGLHQAIVSGILANTDETTWQTNPNTRGMFVAESSPGMFRLADFNGKSPGSLGSVFLGGDGPNSAGTQGWIQPPAVQDLYAQIVVDVPSQKITTRRVGTPEWTSNIQIASNIGSSVISPMNTGIGVQATGGGYTRPLNVTGCWVVKAFGVALNPGSVDVQQLASDYQNLMAKILALQTPPMARVVCTSGLTVNTSLNYVPFDKAELNSGNLFKVIGGIGYIAPSIPGWYEIDVTLRLNSPTDVGKAGIYFHKFTAPGSGYSSVHSILKPLALNSSTVDASNPHYFDGVDECMRISTSVLIGSATLETSSVFTVLSAKLVSLAGPPTP